MADASLGDELWVGSTCWRRFDDWTKRGVWKRLHKLLLRELSWAGEIEWSRAALDSSTVAAMGGQLHRPESDG